MASMIFQLKGKNLRVFRYLQKYPGEWHDAIDLARAIGEKPGTLGAAMRSLERAYHAILMTPKDTSKYNQMFIRSVETPGKPSCLRCGATLAGEYERLCKACLPLDPRVPHPNVQPGSPTKVDLLTARYAAGIPLWLEPYTSPRPGRAIEGKSYGTNHLPD